jgi:hypothetical protein
MKNTWSSGASGTPPAAPGSPSVGFPTDGDPATATPPTTPGAYWFHQITMEIVNAITAAGLTPSQSTLTQLRDAIAVLASPAAPVQSVNGRTGAVTGVVDTSSFTGGNQSLASPGFQKLPGGLILQWVSTAVGDIASGGGTVGSVVFPTTFPTAILMPPLLSIVDATSSPALAAVVTSSTTSGFAYRVQEWAASVQSATLVAFALGK